MLVLYSEKVRCSLIRCNSGSAQLWLIITLQVTLTFTYGMQFTTGQPLYSHYVRLSQSHKVMNILQNAITLLYNLEYSDFLQCKLSSCSKWVKGCYNLMKRSTFRYVCACMCVYVSMRVCVCMCLCMSM